MSNKFLMYKFPNKRFYVDITGTYNLNMVTFNITIFKISFTKQIEMLEYSIKIKDITNINYSNLNGNKVEIRIYSDVKMLVYHLDIRNMTITLIYKLENVLKRAPQSFLKAIGDPREKANMDYDRFKDVIPKDKKYVIDGFLKRKIAFPSQIYIDTNDRLCMVLGVYFSEHSELYDVMSLDTDGKITNERKTSLPTISDKTPSIHTALTVLTHERVSLHNNELFYYDDDIIIYPASVAI